VINDQHPFYNPLGGINQISLTIVAANITDQGNSAIYGYGLGA
jgi:hypothetical protein